MNFSKLIDTVVKPDLVNVFGEALGARIIFAGRAKSNTPIINMSENDYLKFIDAVSRDERLIGMWGASGVQEKTRRWKDAVKTVTA